MPSSVSSPSSDGPSSDEASAEASSGEEEVSTEETSSSSEEDRKLVAAALDGKEEAYERLVEKYERALYYYLRRMVRSEHVLDDLVQESFIKAFEALDSYSPQYAFSTWLYRIAKNHTIDHLRKKRLSTRSIDRPVHTSEGDDRPYQVPDERTYRPDEHIVKDQRRTIIQEAIDALPEKYRRVIELRHQEEMSYKKIAEELDKPLGTIKAHIYRARERLNKHLRSKRGTF